MIKTFEEFNRSSKPRLNEGRHYGMTLHTAERYEKKYTEGIVCSEEWDERLIENISFLIAFLAGYDIEYIFNDLPTDSSHFDFLTYWPSSVSEFGVNRKNLLENLEQVISPDENWENNEATEGLIEEIEKYMTREELYNMLKTLIEQSDDRCDRVYFAWS
jgi:hypothetical protein